MRGMSSLVLKVGGGGGLNSPPCSLFLYPYLNVGFVFTTLAEDSESQQNNIMSQVCGSPHLAGP